MSSNKSRSCREGTNKRSCYGCRHHTKDRQCMVNLEIECSIDGNFKNWEPNLDICRKCVWSTDLSGKLFCLFISGTCLKDDIVFKNAVLNSGKDVVDGI